MQEKAFDLPKPHWADYVVISIFLSICMGIGVYFGRRKSTNIEGYLLGNRKLKMVPVAMSLFVTFASAISLMGVPAEIYLYGTMIFHLYIGLGISLIIANFTVIPLVFPLRLTSTYEASIFHWIRISLTSTPYIRVYEHLGSTIDYNVGIHLAGAAFQLTITLKRNFRPWHRTQCYLPCLSRTWAEKKLC